MVIEPNKPTKILNNKVLRTYSFASSYKPFAILSETYFIVASANPKFSKPNGNNIDVNRINNPYCLIPNILIYRGAEIIPINVENM